MGLVSRDMCQAGGRRGGLLRFVNRGCSVSQSGRWRRRTYAKSMSGTMLFGRNLTGIYYSLSGPAHVWFRLHMLYRKNRGWKKQVCRLFG